MDESTRKKILLVEDEAIIAMAEKQRLTQYGYAVEHVSSGEAAVAHALHAESPPSLILMDIDLGKGIDGTEAAQRILAEIEIPVVFLSSHTEPEVVEKTEKITSYGYVVKNTGATVLDASIKMAFKLFDARRQEQKYKANLLHSRDLMKYVIEHTRGAVAVHDRNLNYIYVSKQYLDQYNVKDRDIIGKHHYEVFPDLPQKFRDAHQRALSGEVSRGEDDPYEREDGSIVWTRWECRPWYEVDDSIGGFIVYTEVLSTEPAKRIKTPNTVNYLRSILRTTREGFYVVDMDGRILDVNEASCEMLGYTREELLRLCIADIAVDEDPALTAERLERIKSTGHATFEARDRRKDGSTFDVEVSASFLGGEDDIVVAFFRDISARKEAEQQLKEKELLLQKILDNSVDLISIADLDGTIRMVSKSHELLGHEPDSMVGRNATDFVHPDDIERIAAVIDQILQFRQQATGEYRYRRRDGEYLWFETIGTVLSDEHGTPEQILFNTRHITESKIANEEMTRQHEELRALNLNLEVFLDYTSDFVYSKDINSRFIFCSQTIADLTGHVHWKDMIGKHDSEVFPPDTAAIYSEEEEPIFENGTPLLRKVNPYYRQDGSPGYIHTNKWPILDEGNNVVGICGISRDITESKIAEDETQRQLTENVTLLKEIHHRIKNNMAQVEGLLVLQVEDTDNAEVQFALREAISRVQSIRVLYEKLLIGTGYRDVSVKDYVESLVDALVAVFPDRMDVHIEKRVADFLLGSKQLIPVGIIINELLTNVFKYSFTGRDEGCVLITLDKTQSHATLVIQDNGIGQDDAFTAGKSTGFGLTIVQMLVQQLNGSYSVETDNGRRTILEFEL